MALAPLSASPGNRSGGAGADSIQIWRFSLGGWLLGLLAAAALCGVAWQALGWLWNTWTGRPEYSHGPLLPLITAFLLWQQKDRLERQRFDGSYWGAALLAIAGALLLLGTIGAAYSLQQYAFVIGLGALAVAWTGLAAWRQLSMPFVVLLLMVPQPDFILNKLSAQLQLLSSSLGVELIRAAGISVFLEGNVIDLGGYRLQVVEACAGLRYLFPLMTLGLLIAYFYRGAWWKRALVFLASVPVTVLMNSFRIGTIGLMVDRWGTGMAEGFVHEFQGWMVFMVSALLLVLLAAILNLRGADRRPWSDAFGVDFPMPTPAGADVTPRSVPRSFLVALGVLAGIYVSQAVIPNRPQVVPAHPPLAAFPHELGSWRGRSLKLPPDVLETLQLDDYALVEYVDDAGHAASLYVSYYATQRDRRVVHSPAACLPGSGWRIESSGRASPAGGRLSVNRMVIANGDQRALAYYWFDQRGRNLTNEFMVKWFLFWDAITLRRSDGAMVRVMTQVGHGESLPIAEQRLDDLVTRAYGPLQTFVPR